MALNPAAALLLAAGASIAAATASQIPAAGMLAPLPLLLGKVVRTRWKTALRRCAAVAPLILMSAGLRAWQDGQPSAGLLVALKAALCVALFAVVSAAYPTSQLVQAFRRLGIPAPLASILALMDRYVNLLGQELAALRRARSSRTTARMPLAARLHSEAQLFGSLILRGLHRSERIHAAVVSRGFQGTWPSPPPLPWRPADGWTLALAAAWILAVLLRG